MIARGRWMIDRWETRSARTFIQKLLTPMLWLQWFAKANLEKQMVLDFWRHMVYLILSLSYPTKSMLVLLTLTLDRNRQSLFNKKGRFLAKTWKLSPQVSRSYTFHPHHHLSQENLIWLSFVKVREIHCLSRTWLEKQTERCLHSEFSQEWSEPDLQGSIHVQGFTSYNTSARIPETVSIWTQKATIMWQYTNEHPW